MGRKDPGYLEYWKRQLFDHHHAIEVHPLTDVAAAVAFSCAQGPAVAFP